MAALVRLPVRWRASSKSPWWMVVASDAALLAAARVIARAAASAASARRSRGMRPAVPAAAADTSSRAAHLPSASFSMPARVGSSGGWTSTSWVKHRLTSGGSPSACSTAASSSTAEELAGVPALGRCHSRVRGWPSGPSPPGCDAGPSPGRGASASSSSQSSSPPPSAPASRWPRALLPWPCWRMQRSRARASRGAGFTLDTLASGTPCAAGTASAPKRRSSSTAGAYAAAASKAAPSVCAVLPSFLGGNNHISRRTKRGKQSERGTHPPPPGASSWQL